MRRVWADVVLMENTTVSGAGDGGSGLGLRRVPAGRPVAQHCGSRHIMGHNKDSNNNDEQQRRNNIDNHEELGAEELDSEVGGSEGKVHVCVGVEACKSTCAVRNIELSVVVNDSDNGNDNDNDKDINESTTSHAQRHGLTDLDAGRGSPSPACSLMWFSN